MRTQWLPVMLLGGLLALSPATAFAQDDDDDAPVEDVDGTDDGTDGTDDGTDGTDGTDDGTDGTDDGTEGTEEEDEEDIDLDGSSDPFSVDLFLGWHTFSENNELGQADNPNATPLDSGLIFGGRFGYAVIPDLGIDVMPSLWIEAELGIVPTTHPPTDTNVSVLAWRAHAMTLFLDEEATFRPLMVLGLGGSTSFSSDNALFEDDTDLVYHFGVGGKVRMNDNWGFRFDGRLLMPPSVETDGYQITSLDTEVLVSVYTTFGGEDAPPDTDGDGFQDPIDTCPEEPEDKDGFQDEDGCPDPDNDQDGILDGEDECPLVPGVASAKGCPDDDRDRDGVPNDRDQCPDDPEDRDGFVDGDGCPDGDNDKDGICDPWVSQITDTNLMIATNKKFSCVNVDQCPNEPETKNNYKDMDGCPDEVPVEVKKFSGTIEGIKFRNNDDKILPASFKILDEAAEVIKSYPDLRIEVQGHTDDKGGDAFNLDLSERRAQSVKKYLLDKGVPANQLTAKGYGETQPKVPNTDDKSRATNRRVEFKRLQ